MQHLNQQSQQVTRVASGFVGRRLGRALGALGALGVVALGCSGDEDIGATPAERGQALGLRLEPRLELSPTLRAPTLTLAPTARPSVQQRGELVSVDRLPFVEPVVAAETFVQRLKEPTAFGENVLVHVKLPAPNNRKLDKSLVRVLGEPDSPVVLFSSDALAQLGKIEKSPGPGFFTAFMQLDEREIERRQEAEKRMENIGDAGKRTLVFQGRTPVAVTTGIRIDPGAFFDGGLIPLGTCPITPVSSADRWGESLMITDPAVVQNTERTNDACLPGGNPDGVWTFKHLMSEMATGSGLSTHDFVVSWLSRWLTPYSVNGDTLPARRQMFNRVILPWANRSGVTATLSRLGVLNLSGPLDLNIAPFRLAAIVNRVDLGATVDGPSGYGGGSTTQPLDAGELRFVFGVQNVETCSMLSFSVIFEYGVPITGCTGVRDWAVEWTKLNDSGFASRFSDAWLTQLEGMTESVVVSGAAPSKGNQNALNQIRTNEIALASPWELREFVLGTEDTLLDVTAPANGVLRPHTVAMTPDDGVFTPSPNATTDGFVLDEVLDGVPPSLPTLPGACSAAYTVPGQLDGAPFRGGNAFTLPPTHWEANVDVTDNRELCARHQFSLNTCNGCHFGETDTFFLHVDPTVMPAALSNFLTGGGAGSVWSVPDPQFGAPTWTFADLERRFDHLYDLACNSCGSMAGFDPGIIRQIVDMKELVPIDPIGPVVRFPFEVGPIQRLESVARLFESRESFIDKDRVSDVALESTVHPAQSFVH